MTKKDYEAAARIVQAMRTHARDVDKSQPVEVCQSVESAFVRLFSDDSPRFDVARFRAACKPGANVKTRRTATARLPYERSEG